MAENVLAARGRLGNRDVFGNHRRTQLVAEMFLHPGLDFERHFPPSIKAGEQKASLDATLEYGLQCL
jgi:hypothetical protein